MKRLVSLVLLLWALLAVVVGSFYGYIRFRSESAAVSSALIAGITSIRPYRVCYAGAESQPDCLEAYRLIKSSTQVRLVGSAADSCYVNAESTVYLTREAFENDTVEAVHEFGHALDHRLYGEQTGYFSRQKEFTDAYAADCAGMQASFRAETLFETNAYRNLAVSDILFAVFYNDSEMTRILFDSYDASGVAYWHHERAYLSRPENRQTEVFADIFTILLSDDDEAKRFLEQSFPACTEILLEQIQEKIGNLTL